MINDSGIARLIELVEADISYVAVGTGSVAISSTQLGNEIFRKSVSDTEIDGNTLIVECFFDTSEANNTLTEIGSLADGATGSAGTGTLFATSLSSVEKDNTQSLTVSFEIEFSEVTA
jgi:hypothetical protein